MQQRWVGSLRRWLARRRSPGRALASATAPPAPAVPDPRVPVILEEWREIRASLRQSRALGTVRLVLFVAASAAILECYLVSPLVPGTAGLARWAWPLFGAALSLALLALDLSAAIDRSELARRGRQLEMALQLLVPGVGPVASLALLSDFAALESEPVRSGNAARCALYAAGALGWGLAVALGRVTASV